MRRPSEGIRQALPMRRRFTIDLANEFGPAALSELVGNLTVINSLAASRRAIIGAHAVTGAMGQAEPGRNFFQGVPE